MKYLKVKDSELVREVNSNAIINRDKEEFNSYLTKRKFLAQQKNDVEKLKSEMVDIKTDINEIKNLLIQVLQRNN